MLFDLLQNPIIPEARAGLYGKFPLSLVSNGLPESPNEPFEGSEEKLCVHLPLDHISYLPTPEPP